MSKLDQKKILSNVKKWIQHWILGLDLCPFAHLPYQQKKIRMSIFTKASSEDMMAFFLNELNIIQSKKKTILSTSLLVYPVKTSFGRFYQFVANCEDSLKQLGLEEEFQLVTFHPRFRFATGKASDPVHYLGRSPYPILHILRSSEVALALKNFKDAKKISKLNEQKFKCLDKKAFKELIYRAGLSK